MSEEYQSDDNVQPITPDADAIRAAFEEHYRRRHGDELLELDVPELGQGMKVYYYPVLSVKDYEKLAAFMHGPQANPITAVLIVFVFAARGADGTRLFGMQALDTIREKFDMDLISDIVARMGIMTELQLAEASSAKS